MRKHILKISLIVFLLFVAAGFLFSQNINKSRKTSYYTYIYKISDAEAKKIYKKGLWKAKEEFFYSLIDSFPTDSAYSKHLPPGHYLRTYSSGNQQQVDIASVADFDVQLTRNSSDLIIKVFDRSGKLIQDADIRVRTKKLRFNKHTQSYTDKKSNQKGLLRVTYKGVTSYYNLNRSYNNPSLVRAYRKVMYATPLKYVWIPVNRIVGIPVRILLNPKRVYYVFRYPQRTVRNIYWRNYNRLECV